MKKRRRIGNSSSSSSSHHEKRKRKKQRHKQNFFIRILQRYDLLLLGIAVILSFIFTLCAPVSFLPWIFLLSLLGIILSLITLLTQVFPPKSKKTMYSLIILCASIMLMITSFVTVKPYGSDSVYSKDEQKIKQQTAKKTTDLTVAKSTDSTTDDSAKTTSATSGHNQSEQSTKEKELGKRTNPIPFKQPFQIESTFKDTDADRYFSAKLEITVVETTRGDAAWEKIKEDNQYNEAPPDGYEYVLNRIKVKLTDAETEDLKVLLSKYHFSYVSSQGVVYDSPTLVLKDGLNAELFNNGEKEGNVCGLIKKEDKPLLRYKNKYFFDIN